MTMGPPAMSEPIPYNFSSDQYCNCRGDYLVSTTHYFIKPSAMSWSLIQQPAPAMLNYGSWSSAPSPYGPYSGTITYSPAAEFALWQELFARSSGV